MSAPAPRLRVATAADVDGLCELMRENYAEAGYPFDPAAARECFAAIARGPALGRTWVLAADGALVGYAVLLFGYSLEYRGRDAFVDDVYLAPAQRGRGLGRTLLEQVEAAARELGVRALHLEVERTNTAAQALYRRRGFRDTERLLMTKIL
jgi:ribosomal protein S18 acetylase RimI-like enzyme